MIGRLLRYPYGNARSRALVTRLLGPEEIAGLLGSPSRDHAAILLERRLPSIRERVPVEDRLQASVLEFGRLIQRTLPEPAGDLVLAYLERNWVENLQTLVRTVLRVLPGGALPQPLPVMNSVPLPEPGELSSLEDLAARLSPGPYREILQAHLSSSEKPSPDLIENRFWLTYWQTVAATVDRLPALDRVGAREILGLRADIDALRSLWRGLDAGLDAAQLIGFWPPLARLVDLQRLGRVLRGSDPAGGLRDLLQRVCGDDAGSVRGETVLRRRLYRTLRREMVSAPFDISVPLSALLLKELEVLDLQGILAGLRFGLESEELGAFVTCLKG